MRPAQIILTRLDQLTAARGWPLVRTGDLRRAVERDGVVGDVFDSTMCTLEADDLVSLFESGATPSEGDLRGALQVGQRAFDRVARAELL